METLPIPRTTLTEMVLAWRQSEEDIRKAFSLLCGAEKRLKDTFKPNSYLFSLSRTDPAYRDYDEPDRVMAELKKDAWSGLVDRMEIRRILSVKRCEELNRQLATGDGLPEITEVNVLAMMEETLNNASQLLKEAVTEVFEFLRPPGSHFKTNSEFEVGSRVIIEYALERWGKNYHVSHYKEPKLTALDNVFHMLDAKGSVKTTRGPLRDAIEKCTPSENCGETDYFKFKCYMNQNLHIEFKRMDLVEQLNLVAGGNRLRQEAA